MSDTTYYIMEAVANVASKAVAFEYFQKWISLFPEEVFASTDISFRTEDSVLDTTLNNMRGSFHKKIMCLEQNQEMTDKISISGGMFPLIPSKKSKIGYVSVDFHFEFSDRLRKAAFRFDDTGFIDKHFSKFMSQNSIWLRGFAKRFVKEISPEYLYIGIDYRSYKRLLEYSLPNGDFCLGTVEYYRHNCTLEKNKMLKHEIRQADPLDVIKTKEGSGIFRNVWQKTSKESMELDKKLAKK